MNIEYTYKEDCQKQYLESGLHMNVRKIRRVNETDPYPRKYEVIQKLLPNTLGIIICGKKYKVIKDDEAIYLKRGSSVISLGDYSERNDGKRTARLNSNILRVDTLLTYPLCPWGNKFDLMYMYSGRNFQNNLVYIKRKLLKRWLKSQSKLIGYLLMKYKKPVYWGVTDSIPMLSIPFPHIHVSVAENISSYDQILHFRSESAFSPFKRMVGEAVKMKISDNVVRKWPNSEIITDNRGWVVRLHDASYDILDGSFLSEIWLPTVSSVTNLFNATHHDFFGTDLQSFYKQLQFNLETGCSISNAVHKFYFTPKDKIHNEIADELMSYYRSDKLRSPLAWGLLIRFDVEGGVTLFSMVSLNKDPVGPFESIGTKLCEDKTSRIIDTKLAEEVFEIL
ncbi:MAG: hypothetical protein U9Q67_03115 [Patescibacteria group bacterium]|nr:hypothetical protein [Patescibacteria group bacterium]